MKKSSIQYFSVVFSILLLAQDFSCLVLKESSLAKRKPRDLQEEKEEINKDVLESKSRQRRNQAAVLLVIAGVSGGLDIFKQQVGCRGETPTLNTKIDLLKAKVQEMTTLKDEINLLWVPVKNKETRINRLESDMVIIKSQVSTKDILQASIIRLVDGTLLDRLRQVTAELENTVNNTNQAVYPSPDSFRQKYYTANTYTLNLVGKFAPIALYLGGKYVLPRVTKWYTTNYANRVAIQRPQLVNSFIDSSLSGLATVRGLSSQAVQSIKASVQKGWQSFARGAPTTARVLSAIGRGTSGFVRNTYKFLQYHSATITYLAQGGLIVFSIVFEAFNLVQFIKHCRDKLKKVENLLNDMDKDRKHMLETRRNITTLQGNLDQVYGYMKGNLTSKEFKNFVREFAQLNEKNQIQNATFINAAITARNYVLQIDSASDLQTEKLNQGLIDALSSVNYNLTCLRSKIAIIEGLLLGCSKGSDNFDTLYTTAKSLEIKKLLQRCITTGYMSKQEMRKTTTDSMILRGKQPICVRNSQTKKNLVCSNWYNDAANITSAKDANITLPDVEYFIATCPPGTVGKTQVDVICGEKQKFVTPYNVSKILFKFNRDQIFLAYNDSCHLTKVQIKDICRMKNDGFTVSQVKEKYLYYNEMNVSAEFNRCKKAVVITPFDGTNMCNYQNNGFKYNNPAFVWQPYENKYGRQAILDHLKTCSTNPPSGDAASRSKYHDRMNEMESFDQQKKSVKPLRIEWI